MFQQRVKRTRFGAALEILELIFHSIVRDIRSTNNNAFVAFGQNIAQLIILMFVFYFMFTMLGRLSGGFRGDRILFIMCGVMLFMLHNKTISAVSSGGSLNPMTKHAPMNSTILIAAGALGALYMQLVSMIVILYGYHIAIKPIEIIDPIGAVLMVFLAWFSGLAVGLIFLALKPWFPRIVGIVSTVYRRANMITSGKMVLGNTVSASLLPFFDWNPLFHAIDQARGYVFINYYPHNSNWEYALNLSLVLVALGLIGEFYTRQHQSLSWGARR